MYIFQIQTTDRFSNRQVIYRFPFKPTKKYGTSHVKKYKNADTNLGWFKTKSLEEAQQGFIKKLKKTIKNIQNELNDINTSDYRIEQHTKDLEGLDKIMSKTILKFGSKYPELFI